MSVDELQQIQLTQSIPEKTVLQEIRMLILQVFFLQNFQNLTKILQEKLQDS